jgi:hypothetical protein
LTSVAILFALGLTGWFAAWLTGLPVIRLGAPQYRARERSHGGRHPGGFGPGLHIADVILRRAKKYRNQSGSWTARWKSPGRFECAECTGARVPLKSSLLFKDAGNPSAIVCERHTNWYFNEETPTNGTNLRNTDISVSRGSQEARSGPLFLFLIPIGRGP